MTKTAFKKLVGNTFFTIRFLKKDDTVRTMTARIGVKKHLKGTGSVRAQSSNKRLVTCWDTVKKDYRSFDLDRVLMIKTRGMFITKGN